MKLSQRAANKGNAARKQIPEGRAYRINIGAGVDGCLTNADKLFRTGESRSANETGLSLFGTKFRVRRQDFRHAVINDFNNRRAAAWIQLQHDIRWLDIPVHHTARFGGSQSARNLLDNFQGERERHWSIAANARLERFAFDQ